MASRNRSSVFVKKGASPTTFFDPAIVRPGSHGTSVVSSGFSDLDKILNGGLPIGSLVMVMEDIDAPHHMLLLRYFMAQGLVHGQPLLFASSLTSPNAFLGTLPGVFKPSEVQKDGMLSKSSEVEGLRIAWQYRKYMDNQQLSEDHRRQDVILRSRGMIQEFCNTFDLRKPVERQLLTAGTVKCVSLSGTTLTELQHNCQSFVLNLSRSMEGTQPVGRIAIQSLCSPDTLCFGKDWEILRFLHFLKGLLRDSNAVAILTFPAALLAPSFSVRWQHMADIVFSVGAIHDDKEGMAALVTDYQDIIGFLRIVKLPSINTQVPLIADAAIHVMKFSRRKTVVLERLNQAPVDASKEDMKDKTVGNIMCSGPANANSRLDF